MINTQHKLQTLVCSHIIVCSEAPAEHFLSKKLMNDITFNDLPNDIIREIMNNYLPRRDVHSCLLSCKKFDVLTDFQYYIKIHRSLTYYCIGNNLIYMCQKICNLAIKLNEEIDLQSNFVDSCTYGHLDLAKYFYQLGVQLNTPVNIHGWSNSDETIFIHCCRRGYLDIAKWIYQLGKDTNSPIYIYKGYGCAFRNACFYNHLDVVKWFCNDPEMHRGIDFEHNGEAVFTDACVNGNLELAKLLYDFGSIDIRKLDIHYNDDEAFRLACSKNQIEVVKWLCSICKRYSYEIQNDKIIHLLFIY